MDLWKRNAKRDKPQAGEGGTAKHDGVMTASEHDCAAFRHTHTPGRKVQGQEWPSVGPASEAAVLSSLVLSWDGPRAAVWFG